MKGLLLLCILFVTGCQVKKGETNNIFEDHVPLPNTFVAASALNTTYDVGQTINFTMTFPYPVTVTGNPRLNLTIGSTSKTAPYSSGSGTTVLNFRYTVLSGDDDLDGIGLNSIDLNGGSLVYNTTENCNLSFPLPNFSSILVDTSAPTITSITPATSGTYYVDQNMSFTVNFSERVTVTGSPRLGLTIGSATRQASYISGSGSSSLLFRYTVTDTDSDTDGISLPSPLLLNSGTITDLSAHAATLNFTPPNTNSVIVAGANPVIRSITSPANATYLIGNQLNFTVNFNKAVTVSGTPQLSLNIGGVSKVASYVSGNGTSALVFRYVIIGGDLDTDGVTLSSPLIANGGSISSGVHPAIPLFVPPVTPGVLVFTSLPALVRVDLPASPPVNGYIENASFNMTAVFAEPMTVTGTTSRIRFDLGGVTKYATYQSGNGSTSLVYRYTVGTTDQDLDGITLQSPLELNGSGIVNGNGNTPILTFTPPTAIVKVDAVAPTIVSNTVPADKIYTSGQFLDFVVTFSEPVVSTTQPRLVLQVGSSVVYANYSSGSGTNALTFRYTVSGTDFDDNGITLINSIDLNGGTIRDLVTHSSNLLLPNTNTTGVIVDATSARIDSITPPSNRTYKTGEVLNFLVHWTKPVDVTGVPRIAITLGSGTVYATYYIGSGSQDHIYRYTVALDDHDYDGITPTSPLNLNGATIRDSANYNALLLYDLPVTTGILIDGLNLSPTALTPPSDGTYKINDVLEFSLKFNYGAYVTGTPRLTIAVGSTPQYATYVSGSGTTDLLFRYTVGEGHSDADGISLTNAVDLNAGTIRDFFGDNATGLSFTVSPYPNKRVDGVRPTISSAVASSNKTYPINDPVSLTLTYSEPVLVAGVPRIPLVVGSTVKYANYVSGSNSNQILFQYLPQNGDMDSDGISASNSIDLNGGSITDVVGNDQTVFTYTVPTLTGIHVDAEAPTVSSVVSSTAKTFAIGETITFAVTYSETVTTTGTPTLSIRVGGATRTASYASGSGSATLNYTYTVVAGDEDTNGVESLSLAGVIRDNIGNQADFTFTPGIYSGVLVDGIAPTISSVTPPGNGNYKSTGTRDLNFVVNYNDVVTVTGVPEIMVTIGLTDVSATYRSGSGTNQLTFRYSVAASDLDLNGISLANSNNIKLSGGTIKDDVGNPAALAMGSLPMPSVVVLVPEINHWYDLSATSTLTYSGSPSSLTALRDRAGSKNFTTAGVTYQASGFNGSGSGYITCRNNRAFTSASTFNFTSVVAVYRASSNNNDYLLDTDDSTFGFSRRRVQFVNPNSISIGANGGYYNGSNFTSGSNSFANLWNPGVIAANALKWDAQVSGSVELCKMDGELAEVILWNTVPTTSDITVLKNYISVKYGIVIP